MSKQKQELKFNNFIEGSTSSDAGSKSTKMLKTNKTNPIMIECDDQSPPDIPEQSLFAPKSERVLPQSQRVDQ